LSPYIYCNSNPIMLIDPSGKQTIGVHGTWSNPNTFEKQDELQEFTHKKFGNNYNSSRAFEFSWSGENTKAARTEGANKLIEKIRDVRSEVPASEPLTLIAHSHGGNVVIEAVNKMMEMPEFDDISINIITINTPVRPDYQLNSMAIERVTHYNVYDPFDVVQVSGGTNIISFPSQIEYKLVGEIGVLFKRTFNNALNIMVDHPQILPWEMHNSHNRPNDWINKILAH
ncbi:MAG: hypothetical protein K2L34_10130, partial [Muribaculaceae bacterium]|nr:hypothetical protein [Muribaculaceae bacterium]